MQKTVLHEVAIPLQLDTESWLYPSSTNGENYRKYTLFLRSYNRMAWSYHECSYCNDPIHSGDWYEACVWLSVDGKKRKLWVEKRHYPECPDRLRDMEEEMRREWERRDREAEAAARRAA